MKKVVEKVIGLVGLAMMVVGLHMMGKINRESNRRLRAAKEVC